VSTLAIHFIWTTYLTWPPGDHRGHWSPLFDFYSNLIERGHKLNLPSSTTYKRSLAIAKEPPILLSECEMQAVANAIGELVAPVSPPLAAGNFDYRPQAYAFAIEPNHVHLLTGAIQEDLSAFIGRVKGMSSSAVLKHAGNETRSRVWTSGYWKVFLFDREGVCAVKDYVEQHNLRRGLPRQTVDWIYQLE